VNGGIVQRQTRIVRSSDAYDGGVLRSQQIAGTGGLHSPAGAAREKGKQLPQREEPPRAVTTPQPAHVTLRERLEDLVRAGLHSMLGGGAFRYQTPISRETQEVVPKFRKGAWAYPGQS
jgi:hypothetical protein